MLLNVLKSVVYVNYISEMSGRDENQDNGRNPKPVKFQQRIAGCSKSSSRNKKGNLWVEKWKWKAESKGINMCVFIHSFS